MGTNSHGSRSSSNVQVIKEFKAISVELDAFLKAVADDLASEIQSKTKVKDADWTSRKLSNGVYKVYNNGNYNLDHLLENGHLVKIKGGKSHKGKQKTSGNPVIHKAYESAKNRIDSHKNEIGYKTK